MNVKRLFVANWKMNSTRAQTRQYARVLSERIGTSTGDAELVIAPPYTALEEARDPEGRWGLAAQNVSAHRQGAFTGEISAGMLAEAGCRYVLIGHSERRHLFGEQAPTLAAKVARVRENALLPIYCLGETEDERKAGREEHVLASQVATLEHDAGGPLVVAYEPVWAIGTGRAATPADAERARALLERLLSGRRDVRILYGGSVTAANARELLEGSGMDGFLIGGASLDPGGFASIAGLS
ncbi:MAG: triose-phosphate isomerase [Acidobacteriota bacterium]